MSGKIYPKKINGKTYYYLQTTYREKINPDDVGKTRGSGKSKVKTKTIYLGTAETIKRKLSTIKEPIEIKHKELGLVGAAFTTAQEIGLIDILKNNIQGKRYGIENWKYFLLAIINRIDHATSKEKMGAWASKTILPELLDFDATRLNSKSFWYATDDVVSEKELNDRREEDPAIEEEIMTGIEDAILRQMEKELVRNIAKEYELSSDVFLYDTTNFFTFFKEPLRSQLAKAAKSKAGRNNLKHVGLALCVDKQWGIPLFHSVYRANSHDTKTFHEIIDELITVMKSEISVNQMILIIDKGNNSKTNFEKIDNEIELIGSLKISDHQDLIDINLDDYTGTYKEFKYYATEKKVMGLDMKLVLTYNDKLYRKQQNSLNAGIKKLKKQLEIKWDQYKLPLKRVPKGIKTILSDSRYKNYLSVRCKKGQPVFIERTENINAKKKSFGKSLLFSSKTNTLSQSIIELYHSKDKIEDGIKLLKDPHLISWQPMRHWTDTKIRAFAFCSIMALVLIRIMEYKVTINNLKMSPQVLKQELQDLKQVILIYDEKTARIKLTHRSTVQKKLWDVFRLGNLKYGA